jgi:arsenate reductase/ArsR family transcriptional regulator
MRKILDIAKALSDANRLRALAALAGGELCVCQLISLLELSPSTVSRHMTVLHQAGLVETRKAGRWVYYQLAGGEASSPVAGALAWVTDGLADDPRIAADARTIAEVRCMDRGELTGVYREGGP